MAGGDETLFMAGAAKPAGVLADVADNTTVTQPAFALLRGIYWRIKRPLGLAFSVFAALMTLPVIVAITLILARQGRPVFIRRQRLGRYGRPFTTYHFRTMSPNSLRALSGDQAPAVDRFGRFLKRTQLDHLPLLWNVIKGEMNMVGPRPMSQEELIGSGRAARHSLSVRPGMTGLWWVNNERDLRRRMALDRTYIDCASPLLDLRILLRTLARMHGV